MCGIFGAFVAEQDKDGLERVLNGLEIEGERHLFDGRNVKESMAAAFAWYGITQQMHRGQDSVGITSNENGMLYTAKRMVEKHTTKRWKGKKKRLRHYFPQEDVMHLRGNMALSQTRYPTCFGEGATRKEPIDATQPYAAGHTALVHNGNVFNIDALREELPQEMWKFPIETGIDTELMLHTIKAQQPLLEQLGEKDYHQRMLFLRKEGDINAYRKGTLKSSIADAVTQAMPLFEGSFSMGVMDKDTMVIARDKYGNKPLFYLQVGKSYFFASELFVLEKMRREAVHNGVDTAHVQEVAPATMLIFRKENGSIDAMVSQFTTPDPHPDVFELIYFSRHRVNNISNVFNGVLIDDFRRRCGALLYEADKKEGMGFDDNTLVAAILGSGKPSAEGYAKAAGTKTKRILWKRYGAERRFIQPDQQPKYLAAYEHIDGKRLILTDDSIVRGDTLRDVIMTLRGYGTGHPGVDELHIRIASPPVLFPHFYGINITSKDELIFQQCAAGQYLNREDMDTEAYQKAMQNTQRYFAAIFYGSLEEKKEIIARVKQEDFELAAYIWETVKQGKNYRYQSVAAMEGIDPNKFSLRFMPIETVGRALFPKSPDPKGELLDHYSTDCFTGAYPIPLGVKQTALVEARGIVAR
ncbi:hypothetical protein HZB01_00255 [Candidatus Woesearchaeota archaeon]|nr:hypothetical protein [Candidatus Woesearchaeota archaeon]